MFVLAFQLTKIEVSKYTSLLYKSTVMLVNSSQLRYVKSVKIRR